MSFQDLWCKRMKMEDNHIDHVKRYSAIKTSGGKNEDSSRSRFERWRRQNVCKCVKAKNEKDSVESHKPIWDLANIKNMKWIWKGNYGMIIKIQWVNIWTGKRIQETVVEDNQSLKVRQKICIFASKSGLARRSEVEDVRKTDQFEEQGLMLRAERSGCVTRAGAWESNREDLIQRDIQRRPKGDSLYKDVRHDKRKTYEDVIM